MLNISGIQPQTIQAIELTPAYIRPNAIHSKNGEFKKLQFGPHINIHIFLVNNGAIPKYARLHLCKWPKQ
jgi:hypothetical protein